MTGLDTVRQVPERTLEDLEKFEVRLQNELLNHPVITANSYCDWFENADLTEDDVRALAIEFSVFSLQFVLAQMNKAFNAPNLENMRESKVILMSELGVDFDKKGNVQGMPYYHNRSHFEWFLSFVEPLNLGFNDIGKRSVGNGSTISFCDALFRIYGSANYTEAMGASYAIENWAAMGFWKQLIKGLQRYNDNADEQLDLSFFIWHDQVEDAHAESTQEEMRNLYLTGQIEDENFFIYRGNRMLDYCQTFWMGLNTGRLNRQNDIMSALKESDKINLLDN